MTAFQVLVKRTLSNQPPESLVFGEIAFSDLDNQLHIGKSTGEILSYPLDRVPIDTSLANTFYAAQTSLPHSLSSSGGVLTVNTLESNYFVCELTENISSVVFNGLQPGSRFDLEFWQNSTGGWSVSGWPSAMLWPGGEPPAFGGLANTEEPIISVMSRNGTVIKGVYSQPFN